MTSIPSTNPPPIDSSPKKFTKLEEVNSSYSAPWYLEIAKTITGLVGGIFDALCFWNWWSSEGLTEDQSKALETIRNKEIQKVKLRYQKKRQLRFEKQQQQSRRVSSGKEPQQSKPRVKSIYEGREFDPSLNVFREFVGEFVENSMECLYEEEVDPILNKRFEVADTIELILKTICPLIVRLGNQTKVDIIEGLLKDQFNNQETLSASFKDTLHRGLHWLLARDEQKETQQFIDGELKAGLVKRLAEKNIAPPIETIDRVVNWIKLHTNKEYNKSLSSLTPDDEKEITHNISQECISYLFETKIDVLYQKVKHKLVDNLDTIIANFLKKNGRIVADEVSGRLAEVLSEVKFDGVIDKVTDLAYHHVKNYLATKEKIEKHVKDADIKHENNEEVEKFIKDNIPVFYPTLPDVHPVVQDIYLGAHESANQEEWRKAIEMGGIRDLVKNTYEVLFGNVTVEIDGQPKSVDWLEYIIERMELPDEISEITEEIKEFIAQVFPVDKNNLTESLEGPSYIISRGIFIAVARSRIEEEVSKLIHLFFNQLMSPEKISSIFSDHLLPSVLEQTIQVHVENIILHKKDILIPLFNQLNEPDKNSGEIIKLIEQKVWETTNEHTEQFDFAAVGITQEVFTSEYTEPIIKSIQKAMKSEELKDVSTDQIIETLLATKKGYGDPRYSEIILDMVFKIGEFGGSVTQGLASLFTDEMNTVVGGTVKSLTEDNNFHLIDLAVAKMQKKFGTKEALKAAFFKKEEAPAEEDAVAVQKRLHGEIKKLSDIIHDIALENINHKTQQSLFMRMLPVTRVSKSVLGQDSTALQNLLIKTFNKILFNQPMNSDFYFKIQDLMLSTMQEADKSAKARNRQLQCKKIEVVS